MAIEFKLPDIGEGIAEGEIVKWLVKPGDAVKEHQSVVEVMTDKATVEVPAPASGTITSLNAKEGDRVPVGSVIFVLETAVGAKAPAQGGHAPNQAAKPAPAPNRAAKPASAPANAPKGANGAPAANGAASRPAASSNAPAKAPAASAAAGAPSASAGSTLEFKLPDIGEGIAEGEIVKWLVKLGDVVKEHQSVVEVMTDKATVEVPAPASGTITALKAKEGERVPVGSVIFSLATAGAAKTAAAPAHAPAHAAAPARTEELVGVGGGARSGSNGGGNGARESTANDKVLAVPSARRLAREMNVDLASVTGSGRNGVVRRSDVEQFANARTAAPKAQPSAAPAQAAPQRAPAQPVSFAAGERETRVPYRGVRRKIGEAMVRSKYTAPHFTVVEEVDVTDLMKLRETAKAFGAEQGVKVTIMPFIMKATALALAKHPMLNGHLDEAAGEIVRYADVHLGIAMDTDNGLIVPVVRDVQAKGILQIASELNELAERTRNGKVKSEELRGSTFSITNAGSIGGTLATPIINFPDIAILGVHRTVKRPGVVETPKGDEIQVRQYMNVSCSVDHRLADGADGARFLVYLKKLLEQPGLLAM